MWLLVVVGTMDAFRLLTRGIKFDPKKLAVVEKGSTQQQQPPLSIEPNFIAETTSIDEASSSDSDNGEESPTVEETTTLSLMGDIKAEPKKKRKKTARERRLQLHREAINHFRRQHRIHVTGTDIPEPTDSWQKLRNGFGFPEDLLAELESSYPSGPTPIQMQTIPLMLERREVLACAPTGSGKTVAYLVPLAHLLQEHRREGFRAVILAPTRELVQQIHREAVKLCGCRGLRVLVLDNASKAAKKFTPEAAVKYDILVSTPNRLVYMLEEEGSCPLLMGSVEWLIVDESDKLFEAGPRGFREQLGVIYRACDQANVRRGMFSATLAVEVENWCKLNLDNVVTVAIGARNSATRTVEQKLVYAGTEKGKLLAFRQLVAEGIKPPVLVFVQSKERAKELLEELQKMDLKADVIHSERSQLQRDNTVKAFRSGRVWVLICTELLGRGIDFKGVNLVVNYDFPPSTVSYIHRIGRTGRAGRSGKAVTLFTDEDKVLLRNIASVIKNSGGEVPEYMLKMKKASRQDKRRLAKSAVTRQSIRQESSFDKARRVKKEQMIAASKRRKRKAAESGESTSPAKNDRKKTDSKRKKKK